MTNVNSTNCNIDTEGLTSALLGNYSVGFSHQVSDLNVWDYALTNQEMELWTSCRYILYFQQIDILSADIR